MIEYLSEILLKDIIMLPNYHTHTAFCDGKNTPEEIVLEAIGKGFDVIGFSEHAPIPHDPESGMALCDVANYIHTVNLLKAKYSGRIRILCGIEVDLFCGPINAKFDYIIGSVHYASKDGNNYVVDESRATTERWRDTVFGGDIYSFCEAYFENEAKVAEITGCDIIGHFDLVTKFNEKGDLIDEENPRYRRAALKALDALVPFGIPFEINTGAISRGYRTRPYPSEWILRELARRGGRVILSSDSHSKSTVDCAFREATELAESCGLKPLEELVVR